MIIYYGNKVDKNKINHVVGYLKRMSNNEEIHTLEVAKNFDLLTEKEIETLEKTIYKNNCSNDKKDYIEYLNSRKTKKIIIEIEQSFEVKIMGIGNNRDCFEYTISVEKVEK